MRSAELVQLAHDAKRVQRLTVHRGAVALFKFQLDELRLVGRILGQHRERCEIIAVFQIPGIKPRVLENPRFGADVQKIAVHRKRLLRTGRDRNAVGFRIGDHLRTAGKFLAEPRIPPGGDHLDFRRERSGRELETNLIVPFAGRPVRDGGGSFGPGDLDHPLRNQRPRDTRTQTIFALVNGSGLQDRIDEIPCEFLLKVIDVTFRRSGPKRLFLEPVEFLPLADVRAECHDLRPVSFLEPVQKNRGVQPPGICDDDFFHRA